MGFDCLGQEQITFLSSLIFEKGYFLSLFTMPLRIYYTKLFIFIFGVILNSPMTSTSRLVTLYMRYSLGMCHLGA